MPRANDMETEMSDLIARLNKSAAVLSDTSMMSTQFPEWLRKELENASELHSECVTALNEHSGNSGQLQPDAGSGGDARADEQEKGW